MYGYIYKTVNLINGKIYIGQHKSGKYDKYYKGSGLLLKEAFNKYGKSNFKTSIIEWCETLEQCNAREIYYINKYNCFTPNGYNISIGGGQPSQKAHTKEARNKTSETLKKLYAEGKFTGSKGSHMSEENKLKLSIRISDNNNPSKRPEVRKKISESQKGHANHIKTKEENLKTSKALKLAWAEGRFKTDGIKNMRAYHSDKLKINIYLKQDELYKIEDIVKGKCSDYKFISRRQAVKLNII